MMYVTDARNDVDSFKYFDGCILMGFFRAHINRVLVIFILWTTTGNSQNTYFNHLTVEDGLSQNSVVSITQDRLGMIWMATQDGLNRYDGLNFEKFNYFFTDVTQTQYSQLGKVYADPYDQLWVSPLDKTTLLRNGFTGIWDTLDVNMEISCFYSLNDDSMLIGTYNRGIISYSHNLKSMESWKDVGTKIYAITGWKNDLYISSDKGLYYKSGSKNPERISDPIAGHHFSDIIVSDRGIWTSTFGKGLFQVKNNQLFRDDRIPENANIQDLHLDRNGNLWVATYGSGLYRISESIDHFTKDNKNKRSIGYDDILCIFESSDGILWFGSDGGGVSYINPSNFKFSSLTVEMVPDNIHVEVIRSISVSDDGTMWMGTSGLGLTSYQPSDGSLIAYRSDPKNKSTLSGDRIVSLFHDKMNQLWIGTQESGINIMYPSGRIFRLKDFPATTIWFIEPTSTGDTLLLGTRNKGLILCNLSGNIIAQYDSSKYKGMTDNNLRAIAAINGKEYIIGSEDQGIFRFNIDENYFSKIDVPLSLNEIKSLYVQGQELWIGTAKNGIGIYNMGDQSYDIINSTNGLPNNVVYSIIPGPENDLWISTNSGICRIKREETPDVDSLSFQCFTTDDGLQGMEFNTGAWYKHDDGKIYLGGLNGINWFDPLDIGVDSVTGKPFIRSIIINNNSFVQDTLPYYLKSISLSHNQDFININYFSPDYSSRKNTEYAYRLLGLSDSWTFTGTQQVAGFTNLPHGDYTFQVAKVWNDSVVPRTINELSISIIPALWQTWWFQSIIIILLISGIYYFYNSRTQYLKDQKEMTEQIKELEMLVLRSQMNPHFIFNSLNSIKNYIIRADRIKASEYISDFAHMVRMILQNSRESEISLEQELESLKLYVELEKMRFKQDVNVQYFIDAGIHLDSVHIPPLLLQPYVENAIWHGLMPKEGKKELNISMLKMDNHITCRIEDNGIGRVASRALASQSKKSYKSLGMGITSERIRLHNKVSPRKININIKDKVDTKGQPTGTLVNINIPIK